MKLTFKSAGAVMGFAATAVGLCPVYYREAVVTQSPAHTDLAPQLTPRPIIVASTTTTTSAAYRTPFELKL